MMKYLYKLLLIFCLAMCQLACKKDFLTERPDRALTVPRTFADFRALLDNSSQVMNYDPTLPTVGCDDFYLGENGTQGLNTIVEQNAYIWAADVYQGQPLTDWNLMYQQIFYCNVVLEGLEQMSDANKREQLWGELKGTALFYRSSAFFNLVQGFAKPYQLQTAADELGIPLRLVSDLNIKVNRASLENSYGQILKDLILSENLLPKNQVMLTRPTANAATSLLARVYLIMGNYQLALNQAEESLKYNANLLDYNSLNTTAVRPFPVFFPNQQNPEVIFYSRMIAYSYLNSALTFVDPLLYDSYHTMDIRKQAFFANKGSNRFAFKGNYSGSSTFFSGLTTREMYLIKAECAARLGNLVQANATMFSLLSKRYKTGFLLESPNDNDVLNWVLNERRKELIGNGLRWSDLRRLNLEQNFAKDLIRNIKGNSYSLPANDKRYVLPIPDLEIQLTGIQQNQR